MQIQTEVLNLLYDVLDLGGKRPGFVRNTPLLGAVAELDSMAVVSLIGGLEDRFGIMIDDDEISGDTFATVGSLTDFVASKLAAA
jgi:acyl carrier protein